MLVDLNQIQFKYSTKGRNSYQPVKAKAKDLRESYKMMGGAP